MKKEILSAVASFNEFTKEARTNERVNDMYLLANNVYNFYKVIEWLENALTKKVKRGLFPEVEYLTQCSTLKQLTGQIYKECGFYLSANEKKDFRRLVALDILEAVAVSLDD